MDKACAIALAESGWWVGVPDNAIVSFQLFEERLCMPFGAFRRAVESCLCRPVFTHEFAAPENLRAEFLGDKTKPTLEEIMGQIPEGKRVLFVVTD